MNCKDLEKDLTLYLYDELSADQRAACESHLGSCDACRVRLEEARQFHRLLSERSVPEPAPELLTQCRAALEQALDREIAQVSWRNLLAGLLPASLTLSRSTAAAALTLVILGFALGWTLHSRAARLPSATNGGATNSSFLGADPAEMRINNIAQVAPGPENGEVRITLDAERRVTLQGSIDDPRIRQVLVDAVKGYDNAGIRRESLDALRLQTGHPNVRSALLYALEKDPNPGVRLEALKTVQTMEWVPEVRDALLGAVEHDANPGVRVAAIDVLVDHSDPAMLPALERLAADDPSDYVRMKSESAVRKMQE